MASRDSGCDLRRHPTVVLAKGDPTGYNPAARGDRPPGEFGMEYGVETVWRNGLRARGKEWVLSELRRRPGQPEDTLYDVVFKEPYPTRAFCFQWCAEEENKVFRMSWHTYATMIALALLIVSILKGIGAWNDAERTLSIVQGQQTMAQEKGSKGASGGGGGSGLSNDIPSAGAASTTTSTPSGSTTSSGSTSSGSGTTRSGSALTTGQSSPSSVCGYITYASPRCQGQP